MALKISIASMVVIGVFATSAYAENDAEFSIKFGHVLNTSHHYQETASKWKELVEKKSEGRIEVDVFPSGQLGGERDLLEGLQYNTLQAAFIGGTIANVEPKFYVLDMPFVFNNHQDARNKLNGELGDALFATLPQHGIKGLAWTESGFRNITNSKRPIKTPEDLKGLKIRVPENQAYVATFKSLGVNPTPIAFPELFTALEQGVVDGQENPVPIIYSSKFQEVQGYMTMSGHLYGPGPMVMSLSFYESLPEDLRQVIDAASEEARVFQASRIDEQEAAMLEELREAGMEIIVDVDKAPFRKMTKSVYDQYQDIIGSEIMGYVR